MAATPNDFRRRIDAALGKTKADLVLKGARYLDVASGELVEGDIAIAGDRIVGAGESYQGEAVLGARDEVVVPGFIDTHVHVESSLVTPAEFERCVLPLGTTTAVCDPHEIANVLGLDGIRYFLESSETLAMDLRVQLSSCVPATHLETAGASLGAAELLALRSHPAVIGLAEMMNFPGLLAGDPAVLEKIAGMRGGHIDGHAPLLRGRDLNAYLSCGISTDHECTGLDEAREKLRKGMQVLIREGSVAKDLEALAPLITERTWPFVALCTDDRNPLDIAEQGHIDYLIRRAIELGAPEAAVYRCASWSGAKAFGMRDRGKIAPGYRADLVLLEDFERCCVAGVICGGKEVNEEMFAGRRIPEPVGRDSVHLAPVGAELFKVPAQAASLPVIGVTGGSILTARIEETVPVRGDEAVCDVSRDLLKVCVLERHGKNGNVGRGFVKGFGFAQGALASSVGHDSHNLTVVGASDAEMALAVNRLIELGGGFVAVRGASVLAELALPLAGLISDQPSETVRRRLLALRAAVSEMGCPLQEAFLQLAFLPLPVIPHLKITDRGLVDVDRFALLRAPAERP